MKIIKILALLLVVFMIGCATTVEEVVEEEAQDNIVEEVVEVEEVSNAANGADVKFTGKGFVEDMVIIKAGSTVDIIIDEDIYKKDEGNATKVKSYSFEIVETGLKSRNVGSNTHRQFEFEGNIAQLEFEEPGEYEVTAIPFNKILKVMVE